MSETNDTSNNINYNRIKNALFKLKNKKNEKTIQTLDNSNKDEKINLEIKLLNKKREKSEENQKINNEYNITEDIIKDKLNENTIEIKDDEDNDVIDNDIIDNDKSDNDFSISNEDNNNKIQEEEDESFSIPSEEHSNNINDESTKINKKKKKKSDDKISKINSKIKKNNTINYKKGNKRTILKRKKYYVYQLLQRWWYALPKWPPDDLDVTEKLRENKLRLVEEKNWKKEVELTSDDFKKCIELPGYKYVYMTKDGKIYDFRPEKDKPSFTNLMKMSDLELHRHLVNALKKQLEELDKRNYYTEKELRQNIRNQLVIAKLNLKHIQKE